MGRKEEDLEYPGKAFDEGGRARMIQDRKHGIVWRRG
jgi:hypothetical protein